MFDLLNIRIETCKKKGSSYDESDITKVQTPELHQTWRSSFQCSSSATKSQVDNFSSYICQSNKDLTWISNQKWVLMKWMLPRNYKWIWMTRNFLATQPRVIKFFRWFQAYGDVTEVACTRFRLSKSCPICSIRRSSISQCASITNTKSIDSLLTPLCSTMCSNTLNAGIKLPS